MNPLALAALLLAGAAGPLAFALAGNDVFNSRNVLGALVVFCVLLDLGLGSARAGRLGLLGAAGLVALSALAIFEARITPALQRDDWRGALARWRSRLTPRA